MWKSVLSSTSHGNINQEAAAQMCVHNNVHTGAKQSALSDVQAGVCGDCDLR